MAKMIAVPEYPNVVAYILDKTDILLNKEECMILYHELSHNTSPHHCRLSAIVRKIAASAQGDIIERAKDNRSKD